MIGQPRLLRTTGDVLGGGKAAMYRDLGSCFVMGYDLECRV
jgi:hypothetical protein